MFVTLIKNLLKISSQYLKISSVIDDILLLNFHGNKSNYLIFIFEIHILSLAFTAIYIKNFFIVLGKIKINREVQKLILKNEILIGILSINLLIYYITKEVIYSYDHGLIGLMLTKPIKYWNITKRNMLTSKNTIDLAIQVANKNRALCRSMSLYKLRKAEKNPKDSRALPNNPQTKQGRHHEIVKSTCSKKDCGQKICPPGKPCVPPIIEEKAVANTTHGTKNTSSGTNQELDPNQDYSGNPKAQRAIFYKDAHNVGSSTEIPDGTKFVNKPDVAKIIKKYEDKK